MKNVPWIIIIILLLLIGGYWLFFAPPKVDVSEIKRKYDSAGVAGARLLLRTNVLASGLSTEREKFKSLQRAANKESDSLVKVVDWWRLHPKVRVIRESVPEIDTAFVVDSVLIAFQKDRIQELESLDSAYKSKDSVFHVAQDSLIGNIQFRHDQLADENKILEKDLKAAKFPLKLGVNVGGGTVYSGGQLHVGPGVHVGLTYVISFRKRRR